MSDAERQQRHRKKLRKAKLATGRKAERQRELLKAAGEYIPVPPGVTHWVQVTITEKHVGRTIWHPVTRPLPAMNWNELTDDELFTLQERLDRERNRRSAKK